MATSSRSCGICELRHIINPSIVWCTECDESLCKECKEHHSLSKVFRNHTVADIAKFQNLSIDVLNISQYCTKHNEKYRFFCQKHECPCCDKCIVESQNKCQNLVELDDFTHNVKTSYAQDEMEKTLVELAANIQKIRKHQQENLTSFNERRKEIEEEVLKTRTNVNNHLDKLQEEFMNKLHAIEEKENSEVCFLLSLLEKKEKEITAYQTNILNMTQYKTDLHVFLSMKQIEEYVNSKDIIMQSLGKSTQQHSITYRIDTSIQNIMLDMQSFGEVYIESKPCNIALFKKKTKQAQMTVHVPIVQTRSIANIKLTKHNSITTGEEDISGCCMLPDGKLAFSYLNKKTVQVLNSKGLKEFEIDMPSAVFDIVYINQNNTLAGTSGASQNKCIYIIDLVSKNIMKSIPVNSYNYGIALKDNQLIYSGLEKGIQMIHLNDESIITDRFPCQTAARCYMATFKDNIYHTNHKTNTVTCYNLQGELQWTFFNESVLKDPRGIDVDGDGNVYVVGFISQNLIVISANGKQHRELSTADDDLSKPITLHYYGPNNQLLIAYNNNTAYFFNVTNTA